MGLVPRRKLCHWGGCRTELTAWGRGGLSWCLSSCRTGRGAGRDSPAGLTHGATLLLLLHQRVPCLPCPPILGVPSLLWVCFQPSSVFWCLHLVIPVAFPCSHHHVSTSGTGLSDREPLHSPQPITPAKLAPARPPANTAQTHGPTSSQSVEKCQSNKFNYLHIYIAFS